MRRHVEILVEPRDKTGKAIPGNSFLVNDRKLAFLYPNQVFIKFQIEKQVSSEPNVCNIEVYNLSEEHSSALDFKYDANNNIFGPFITISGGYLDGEIKTMFTGVIVQALTTFKAPDYVTVMQCQNIQKETNKKWIEYQVAKGLPKADAIIEIIKQAGGKIEAGEQSRIREVLSGREYDEDEQIRGRFGTLMSTFNKAFEKEIFINWDDAGVSLTPPGVIAKWRETRKINESSGLISAPTATQRGVDCEILLDASYRINDPLIIESITTARLKASADRTVTLFDLSGELKSAVIFSGKTVVTKVIHSGDNRDGDFKTSLTSNFTDLRTENSALT